jgi:meiotically up-regulated gene 157 (Mug157) protein
MNSDVFEVDGVKYYYYVEPIDIAKYFGEKKSEIDCLCAGEKINLARQVYSETKRLCQVIDNII